MSLGADTTGAFVITPTPYHDDGWLALDDILRMVVFFLEREVQGLTLGMMGEAAKLTESESHQVVRAVLRAAGTHVPVVVGVPTGNFATMHHLALGAMTGFAFPEMMRDVIRGIVPAIRRARLICSTHICRWFDMMSRQGLASRCASTSWCAAVRSAVRRSASRRRTSAPTTSMTSIFCLPSWTGGSRAWGGICEDVALSLERAAQAIRGKARRAL